MQRVALAAFKDNASTYFASAEAGEEIEVTRRGKVVARVVPPGDRGEAKRQLIAEMMELGNRVRAENGPTTAAEIRSWIEEDRK